MNLHFHILELYPYFFYATGLALGFLLASIIVFFLCRKSIFDKYGKLETTNGEMKNKRISNRDYNASVLSLATQSDRILKVYLLSKCGIIISVFNFVLLWLFTYVLMLSKN